MLELDTENSLRLLDLLEERKKSKKQSRPGNPEYYRGSKKSNIKMSKEINKCEKKPMPKSCYDYWSADKEYDKSKKKVKEDSFDETQDLNEISMSGITSTLKKLKEKIPNVLGASEAAASLTSESLDDCFERVIQEVLAVGQLNEAKKKKKKSRGISAKIKKTLKKKAENANMPLGALTSVYRKGLAAWLTGHRQGVPQHAWAMARVNSFIRGGKTRSVDKGEWKKVQQHRK